MKQLARSSQNPLFSRLSEGLRLNPKKTTELKNDCLVLSFDRHDKKLNKNP
jgi:hypothetical protein